MGKLLAELGQELSLACRQLGWLHSTPDPPKNQRGAADRRCRMQRMKDDGIEPAMPEMSAGHLLEVLLEVGPALPGANGAVPLTHSELRSWQENTGIELSAWEARTLRALSREYVGELQAGCDPKRLAPYQPETTQANKERVSVSMRAAIAAMAVG